MTHMTTSLGLKDRCDRCGHRSAVTVMRNGADSELVFCGSHFDNLSQPLAGAGWTVVEDTRTDPALGN